MSIRIVVASAVLATILILCSVAFGGEVTSRPAEPTTRPDAAWRHPDSTGLDWLAMVAESEASQPASGDAGENVPGRAESPAQDAARMVPWTDYSGDIWHRAAMTGDWGGVRQKLMDKGIRFNVNLTQILQGNVHGGVSKRAWYQGGLRYDIDLDTGAAGLWPGGLLHLRGETPYGKNDNANSSALMPVNTDALYPFPNSSETCLSEANYTQFVAPWLGFTGGKFSPREANVFAHDETTQFMNMAFNYNPIYGTTLPLDFLGAGVIARPADWFTVTTLVLDSEGQANVSGFDTVFDRGTSVFQMLELAVKPFGLPGHQRVGWSWSDTSRIKIDQNIRHFGPEDIARFNRLREILSRPARFPRLQQFLKERFGPSLRAKARQYARIQIQDFLATLPDRVDRQGQDWALSYDFDQYLYVKPGTKDQGFGLFGRFGTSDGTVNPIGQFYSIGLGGKGMIPTRDNDTYGAGYYYLAVSDKFGPIISRLIGDEQGVEVYYNIAITPWMHLSPNIQVIEPGRSRFSDSAVVVGIRMRIDF